MRPSPILFQLVRDGVFHTWEASQVRLLIFFFSRWDASSTPTHRLSARGRMEGALAWLLSAILILIAATTIRLSRIRYLL